MMIDGFLLSMDGSIYMFIYITGFIVERYIS